MPADTSDRARPYDVEAMRETIGEDPGRFLDRPLVDGAQHTSSPAMFIRARIRGIDRIDVVRAWIAVERRLDRGPREHIIELLEAREVRLEAIGERPARLAATRSDRDVPETQWSHNGEPWDAGDRCVASVPAVATDGGES